MSTWTKIEDAMPPLELPVWLFVPELRQPIVGCRTDDGDGWLWARCYADFHWDHTTRTWKTYTAEEDDILPTLWMPLPEPPTQ